MRDPAFHKRFMGVVRLWGAPHAWDVGGRVDAMSADGTRVLEVKNRVHRLRGSVPLHENVQLQSYMFALEVEEGALVECLRRSDAGRGGASRHCTQSEVHVVPRDPVLWGRVCRRLAHAMTFLASVLDSPDAQDAYLALPRDQRAARVLRGVERW